MTNAIAIQIAVAALLSGHVLHAQAPNGEAVTIGRGDGCSFMLVRYGRSRWALPSGKDYPAFSAREAAKIAVQHVGRGPLAAAARRAGVAQ